MKNGDGRTVAQIREEIGAERAQLNAALATFGAEAKRSGRIAGSALTALAGVRFLLRLRARLHAR